MLSYGKKSLTHRTSVDAIRNCLDIHPLSAEQKIKYYYLRDTHVQQHTYSAHIKSRKHVTAVPNSRHSHEIPTHLPSMKTPYYSSDMPFRYQFMMFVLLSLGCAILSNQIGILGVWLFTRGAQLSAASILSIQAITTCGAFLIPSIWLINKKKKLTPDYILLKNRFKSNMFLSFLLLYLLISPGITYLENWAQTWQLPANMETYFSQKTALTEKTMEMIFNTSSPIQFVAATLVIAFLAGISEEFFFRGCIQNLILEWSKKKHLSIWITAIIFSAVHLDLAGFLPRLLLGAMLGYSYALSSSIWLPISLHTLNNLLMCFILLGTYHNRIPDLSEGIGILPGILSLVLATLLMILMWKKLGPSSQKVLSDEKAGKTYPKE